MKRMIIGVSAFSLLLAACAGHEPYIPEEKATATMGGRTAARYPIAATSNSKGDIRVASYGISELERADSDKKLKAVHIRLAVANSGAVPMSVDAREQRLQLENGATIAPAAARSPASPMPVVQVPAESSRVVDLYFPVPKEPKEDQPPRFDVVWRVNVGDKIVSEVTPFDKVEVDPAVARQELAEDVVQGPYWYDGPAWWW